MDPKERDKRWKAAKAAGHRRMKLAKAHGCESPQAREAWIVEERAWQHAMAKK